MKGKRRFWKSCHNPLEFNYMKLVTIILFIICATDCMACECAEQKLIDAQHNEYVISDLIIIGNVIKISDDKQFLTLVIKEIFKGDQTVQDTIIFKNNYYCEPYVDFGGDWLLYGQLTNGVFRINECGLSRSFMTPERNLFFRFLPQPPPEANADDESILKEEIRIDEEKAGQTAQDELKNEIAELRFKKK